MLPHTHTRLATCDLKNSTLVSGNHAKQIEKKDGSPWQEWHFPGNPSEKEFGPQNAYIILVELFGEKSAKSDFSFQLLFIQEQNFAVVFFLNPMRCYWHFPHQLFLSRHRLMTQQKLGLCKVLSSFSHNSLEIWKFERISLLLSKNWQMPAWFWATTYCCCHASRKDVGFGSPFCLFSGRIQDFGQWGPSRVLTPEGGLEPKIYSKWGFCPYNCLKTAWFWTNLGGEGGSGPLDRLVLLNVPCWHLLLAQIWSWGHSGSGAYGLQVSVKGNENQHSVWLPPGPADKYDTVPKRTQISSASYPRVQKGRSTLYPTSRY